MAGIDKKDTFQPIFAPSTEAKATLIHDIGGKTGIEALLYVLKIKRKEQRETIDGRLFSLVAATGAGKSTGMVYHLWKEFIATRRRSATLLCTQPQVNLARSNPATVEEIFGDVHMGKELGYITGYGRVKPTEDRNIIYCTTQILPTMMENKTPQSFGRSFPIVIIDEAHDQSIEMVRALKAIKDYVIEHHKETWCPLFITTSATIDPPTFIRYFTGDPESPYNSGYISGTTRYPITTKHVEEKETEDEMLATAIRLATEAVEEIESLPPSPMPDHTDILVFWPSTKEIDTFLNAMKEKLPSKKGWTITYIRYTRPEVQNNTENYVNLYRERNAGEIRLIGSTTILEQGATLYHLRHVIDMGKRITPIPFPLMRRVEMITLPTAKSTGIQRRGRVGRTGPGSYWTAYTELTESSMAEATMSSTLTNSNIPSMIYAMIAERTKKQYETETDANAGASVGASNRSIFALLQLLATRRTRETLPSIDVCNDLDLLNPISMEMYIETMASLTATGLIEKDASLSMIGVQLALHRSNSIAEAFLRISLSAGIIHPFDIELICIIIKQSLMEADIGGMIMWGASIKYYYTERSFGFKDPPPRISDVISVFRHAQLFLGELSGKKLKSDFKGMDKGALKYSVYGSLENLDGDMTNGAFFSTPYVDSSKEEMTSIEEKIFQSLEETSRRMSKGKALLEGEVASLRVLS